MEALYPPDYDNRSDPTHIPGEFTQEQILEANIDLFARNSAIPLLNRLRYLVGDDDMPRRSSRRFTELDELAASLNANLDELVEIIMDLRIPSDMTPYDEFNNLTLAPNLDIVIADEYRWRKAYGEQDDEITASDAADILGPTYRKTISKMLADYGIEPRVVYRGSAEIRYYPKPLLYRVRAELMIFPPAGHHKTMAQIVGAIGCGRKWANEFPHDDYPPDLMRTSQGRIMSHYPPEFEEILLNAHGRRENATEDMRTMTQIADELGRDVEWVQPRLIKYYKNKRKLFRQGTEHTFYGNDVYIALRQQSEEQRKIPVISAGEATLNELIEPLDTTHETAGRVLRQLNVKHFDRLSAYTGKVMRTYDISIRAQLARAIVEDREQQVVKLQAVIDKLSPRPKATLTPEERKEFRTARQRIVIMTNLLQRARTAYERLIDVAAEK